ncbi:MAG: metallophosphoesterase [Pseudomonadota bacterium]|nr:metallophosphoesterase [Pseudomonadota bacterium]
MKYLYHISDLHFGRDRATLYEPLLEELQQADAVALSGDLTQRARHGQFRAAKDLLDRIPAPCLVVPGNHDVPLDLFWQRIFTPFRNYKRHISRNLSPEMALPEMTLIGMNTVNPLRWQRGKVPWLSMPLLCQRLPSMAGLRILVAHHPFEQPEDSRKAPMRGGVAALNTLADCGLHMVLTGHLHKWRMTSFITRRNQPKVLQVHAGTGLSTRLRGEENDFAKIGIEGDQVQITRMVAGEEARFKPAQTQLFRLTGDGWVRH